MIISSTADTKNETHSSPLSLSHVSKVQKDDWLLHLMLISTLVPRRLQPTSTNITNSNKFYWKTSKQFWSKKSQRCEHSHSNSIYHK